MVSLANQVFTELKSALQQQVPSAHAALRPSKTLTEFPAVVFYQYDNVLAEHSLDFSGLTSEVTFQVDLYNKQDTRDELEEKMIACVNGVLEGRFHMKRVYARYWEEEDPAAPEAYRLTLRYTCTVDEDKEIIL